MGIKSAVGVLSATKSFVLLRLLVHGAMTLATLLFWGLLILIGNALGGVGAIILIIGVAATFGFLQLGKRYVLYLIRAGHVYAITRYMNGGEVPNGNAYLYCKQVVSANFATVNVGALMDALVGGAVRQIMGWINKAQNLLRFIPGASSLFSLINAVLRTAGNYIDEAVLSYVFLHEQEPNKWKVAADGVVLYAQSWKGMLQGAAKVVAMVWTLRVVIFLVFAVIGSVWGGVFALILGWAMAWFLDGALVDPFATIIMIEQYAASIRGVQPTYDLYNTLSGVSAKFRELLGKAKTESAGDEQPQSHADTI